MAGGERGGPAAPALKPHERIVLALDVPEEAAALSWAKRMRDRVGYFKVGLQLFTAAGPALPARIAGEFGPVFLDLKLHDIPNTVAGAVRAASRLSVSLLTVHALGGTAMMAAACEAAAEVAPSGRPRLLAVTLLTSLVEDDLASAGIWRTPEAEVVALAEAAWASGCDGIVASPWEARALRLSLGEGPLLVTPGIRGASDAAGDQRRTAGARDAVLNGADLLVVGRPVLAAPDPEAALEGIVSSLPRP